MRQRTEVALLLDYDAYFTFTTPGQAQGAEFSYVGLLYTTYTALRRRGVDVDVVPPARSLAGYKLVVVPSLPHITAEALRALSSCRGSILFGPRSGSKTDSFCIPTGLPPGPLRSGVASSQPASPVPATAAATTTAATTATASAASDTTVPDVGATVVTPLLPLCVTRVESFRPGYSMGASGPLGAFRVQTWREWVEVDANAGAEVMFSFDDGKPAVVAFSSPVSAALGMDATCGPKATYYLGFWPSPDLLAAFLPLVLQRADVRSPVLLSPGSPPLPAAVRVRCRGDQVFAFNYGDVEVAAPAPMGAHFVLGGPMMEAHGVAVWKRN